MARSKSNLKCPNCGELGGFLTRRWVKAVVNVPRRDKITCVADAWEYGAKVHLRIREMAILSRDDENSTISLATNGFNALSEIMGHTEGEIKNFESKIRSQIPRTVRSRERYFSSKPKSNVIKFADGTEDRRTDPIHLKLPQSGLKNSKFANSLLYGALVCLAVSRIIRVFPGINKDDGVIESVFTHFNILHADTRCSFTLVKYYKIFLDAQEHGFRAATRLNGVMTSICKKCSYMEKNTFTRVGMVKDYNSPTKLRCQRCGGTEGRIRYLTVKHLKKKEPVVRKIFADFDTKMNTFLLHIMDILKILRSNDDVRGLLLKTFEYYMNLAIKDRLLLREHYFVGHYDNAKKSNRRWCSLTIKQVRSLSS
jgi:hypothetical protein